MKALAILLLSACICASCKYFKKEAAHSNEIPVAKVQDSYLYRSELQEIMKSAKSSGDSVLFMQNYVRDWVRRQLMIQKALLYMPAENLDVEQQVNDYRESLILYAYEKELILQKLDTTVSAQAQRDYFNQYQNNFELEDDLVQLQYVQTAADAPKRDSLLGWLVSQEETDKIKLEDYCYQYATDFSLSDSVWMEVQNLLKTIPVSSQQLQAMEAHKGHAAVSDSLSFYVLKITGFRQKGKITPFEFIKNEIHRIILNKRKIDLVRSTYDNIYDEAERNKEFEIYE